MPTISVLNPKGGCAKTTLATNLAVALRPRRVLLVDTDPQGSARDWHAAREAADVALVAMDRAANLRSLEGLAGGYDDVLIDGAAKLEDTLAAAIKLSDAVLIPVQPSPYDIWAAGDLVDLVKARQELTNKPVAAFVVVRAVHNTRLANEVVDALAQLGLPLLETRMMQRQAYPQTAARGETVFDGSHPEARAEMLAIAAELTALMKKETTDGTERPAA